MENKKQKNKKNKIKKADNSSASFDFEKSMGEVKKNNKKIESEMKSDVQKNEKKLSLQDEIIKNMPEGIYFVSFKDGIIVYANPKFEKMFGYSTNEMIGKHASIVNAPIIKKPKETASEIMGIMEKTGEWFGEINNIKKDGTSFWCNASCFLFNHPEYGKIIVAMHTDITEKKEAQIKLQEKLEELEKINKLMVGRELKMIELKQKISNE